MVNKWRPKDWENPYHKSGDFGDGEISWNEYPEFQIYEEGANAILQAIWNLAQKSPTKTFTFDANGIQIFRE